MNKVAKGPLPQLRGHPELVWLARQLNLSLIAFVCMIATFVLLSAAAGWYDHTVRKVTEAGELLGYTALALYMIAVIVNGCFLYRLAVAEGMRWWIALPIAIVASFPIPLFPIGVGAIVIGRGWYLLRVAGASVGLRGVGEQDIDKLRARWCQHCGAAREGRALKVPCPECRMGT